MKKSRYNELGVRLAVMLLVPSLVWSVPLENGGNQLLQEPMVKSADIQSAFVGWCSKHGKEHLIGTAAFEAFKANLGV